MFKKLLSLLLAITMVMGMGKTTFATQMKPIPHTGKLISSESVVLHHYEYMRTDSGTYYWNLKIPTFSMNPNKEYKLLSIWDNKTVENDYATKFANHIDSAKDDEYTIAIYTLATIAAVIVGLISKSPILSIETFKYAYVFAVTLISFRALKSVASYYNNLDNARKCYLSIRKIVE